VDIEARAEGDTTRVDTREFSWRHGAVITVGRAAACDVVLEDRLVSRTHLRVEAAPVLLGYLAAILPAGEADPCDLAATGRIRM
jgi:hypothetical protein